MLQRCQMEPHADQSINLFLFINVTKMPNGATCRSKHKLVFVYLWMKHKLNVWTPHHFLQT